MNNFSDRAKYWIKKHTLVIIFASLVGILSVLPHLLAQYSLGDAYQGIPFMYEDNEDYYLTRIREITEGHYFVGSAYFHEYKDTMPVVFPIGEYFYYALYLICGMSLAHTLVFAKFLFPLILFLLVYALVYALTKEDDNGSGNTWAAIAAGLMVTLGIELVEYHTLFSRLLHGTNSEILSMWTRPVNPITGGIMLFAFLNLLWRNTKEPSWKLSLLAGAILALSVGYIFSFGTGFAILGTLLCFTLFWKKYLLAKHFVLIACVSIIIPAAYILPQLSGGENIAGRNGLMLMHAFFPNKILLCVFFLVGILLIYAYRTKKQNIFREYEKYLPLWFAISMLLGGFFALNQQVLTGRTIWPYHFVQYTIPLGMITSLVALFYLLRPHLPSVWKFVIGVSVVLPLAFSIWNIGSYRFAMESFKNLQEYAPIFAWIETNAPKDCVVLTFEKTGETLERLVPAFTHCDVYTTSYLVGGAIPKERIEHNFFVKLQMRGVTPDTIEKYLKEHEYEMWAYFYDDWFEVFGLKPTDRFKNMIPDLASKYTQFFGGDFKTALERYEITYIVSEGELMPDVSVVLPSLHNEYQSGTKVIYTIK